MIWRKPTDPPRCFLGFALQMMALWNPSGSPAAGAGPGPEQGQGSHPVQPHSKHITACPRGQTQAVHTKHFGGRLRGASEERGSLTPGREEGERELQGLLQMFGARADSWDAQNPDVEGKDFHRPAEAKQENRERATVRAPTTLRGAVRGGGLGHAPTHAPMHALEA